ncbi:MAG: hypothetical protein AAGC77_14660, partial [Pseudomonadota bacterium]
DSSAPVIWQWCSLCAACRYTVVDLLAEIQRNPYEWLFTAQSEGDLVQRGKGSDFVFMHAADVWLTFVGRQGRWTLKRISPLSRRDVA